jgi:hypothetical protein
MARQLDSLGALRAEAQVKLFGGGDVLSVSDCASRPTIGQLNCEAALQVLEEEGFSVAASRLGGNEGVNIQFQTETGEVLLRRLDSGSMPETRTALRPIHRSGQADKGMRHDGSTQSSRIDRRRLGRSAPDAYGSSLV